MAPWRPLRRWVWPAVQTLAISGEQMSTYACQRRRRSSRRRVECQKRSARRSRCFRYTTPNQRGSLRRPLAHLRLSLPSAHRVRTQLEPASARPRGSPPPPPPMTFMHRTKPNRGVQRARPRSCASGTQLHAHSLPFHAPNLIRLHRRNHLSGKTKRSRPPTREANLR